MRFISKFQNVVSHIKVEGELKTKNIKYSWELELHITKILFILHRDRKYTLRTYNIIKQPLPNARITLLSYLLEFANE